MSDVNHEAVDIPDDKPPSEYHRTERRAEILQLIETAGHPGSISPTRLADRYDVSGKDRDADEHAGQASPTTSSPSRRSVSSPENKLNLMGAPDVTLSPEQREILEHVAEPRQLAALLEAIGDVGDARQETPDLDLTAEALGLES